MDGAEKRTKQGRDCTTQKKTNLIQEEHSINLFHTFNDIMEQMYMYRVLCLYYVSLLLCCIISTLFLSSFQLHPYMQRGFYRKLFTLVSFNFCVPQAKTLVMNGNTMGQFNTTALAVSYVCFFRIASCMPPLEANDQMLCTAVI